MTAMVSRERATATWLTGAAGLLILAAAFVMMACAAPSLVHARRQGAVTQAARVYTSLVTHKLVREPGRPGGSGQAAATLGSAPAISGNRLHLATRSPHESAASRRGGHRTGLFAGSVKRVRPGLAVGGRSGTTIVAAGVDVGSSWVPR